MILYLTEHINQKEIKMKNFYEVFETIKSKSENSGAFAHVVPCKSDSNKVMKYAKADDGYVAFLSFCELDENKN